MHQHKNNFGVNTVGRGRLKKGYIVHFIATMQKAYSF